MAGDELAGPGGAADRGRHGERTSEGDDQIGWDGPAGGSYGQINCGSFSIYPCGELKSYTVE